MKIGDKVKVTGYLNDKYNPKDIEGTVISLDGKYNPIIVLWDSGIRNSYIEKNLMLV